MIETLVFLLIFGVIALVGGVASALIAWAVRRMFRTLSRYIVVLISALPFPFVLLIKAHSIFAEYTTRLRLDLTAWERDGDAIGYGISILFWVIAALGAFLGGLCGGWLLARRKFQ